MSDAVFAEFYFTKNTVLNNDSLLLLSKTDMNSLLGNAGNFVIRFAIDYVKIYKQC